MLSHFIKGPGSSKISGLDKAIKKFYNKIFNRAKLS